MEIYIKDRLYIPQIISQPGNFSEFNLKRSIKQKIAITDEDRETYSIVANDENKSIEWDIKKDMSTPLVVEFTKEEITYIKKSCESLIDTVYPDDFWLTVEKIYNTAQ